MRRLAVLVLLVAVQARAAPPVTITGAWARATAPHQTEGVVYLSLSSIAGDAVLSVTSADAADAMLHRSTGGGSMAGMADMDALDLPAGKTVTLAPHGMHVMLMGLKHPLTAGGHVALRLVFARAAAVELVVPVLPIGSAGPR